MAAATYVMRGFVHSDCFLSCCFRISFRTPYLVLFRRQQPSLSLEFFVVFLDLTECRPEVRLSTHYCCRYTNAKLGHDVVVNVEFIVVFKKDVSADTIGKHEQELSNAGMLYNTSHTFPLKIVLIDISVRVEDRWLDSQQV